MKFTFTFHAFMHYNQNNNRKNSNYSSNIMLSFSLSLSLSHSGQILFLSTIFDPIFCAQYRQNTLDLKIVRKNLRKCVNEYATEAIETMFLKIRNKCMFSFFHHERILVSSIQIPLLLRSKVKDFSACRIANVARSIHCYHQIQFDLHMQVQRINDAHVLHFVLFRIHELGMKPYYHQPSFNIDADLHRLAATCVSARATCRMYWCHQYGDAHCNQAQNEMIWRLHPQIHIFYSILLG